MSQKKFIETQKSFELFGKWWLPDSPNEEFVGVLKFDAHDRTTLEASSLIRKLFANRIDVHKIILGRTIDRQLITLHNCYLEYETEYETGQIEGDETHYRSVDQRFFVSEFFIGYHFYQESDIEFDQLAILFSNLERWMFSNPISIQNTNDEDYGLDISYNQPKPLTIDFEDIQIRFRAIRNIFTDWNEIANLKVKCQAEFISKDKPLSLRQLHPFVRDLQDFLSLCFGEGAIILSTKGYKESSDSLVEIFHSSPTRPEKIPLITSESMIFSIKSKEFATKLENHIVAWFSLSQKYQIVRRLLFSSWYVSLSMIEAKFLSLTQAVESYHREKYGGYYLKESEYKKNLYPLLCNTISDMEDKEFKDHLKDGTFKYAYQFSLRKRIRDWTEQIVENGGFRINFLRTKEKRRKFAGEITSTRNYFTHYSDGDKKKALSGSDLIKANQKLEFLLLIEMFHDAGFTYEAIHDLFYEPIVFRKFKKYLQ